MTLELPKHAFKSILLVRGESLFQNIECLNLDDNALVSFELLGMLPKLRLLSLNGNRISRLSDEPYVSYGLVVATLTGQRNISEIGKRCERGWCYFPSPGNPSFRYQSMLSANCTLISIIQLVTRSPT